MLLEAIYHCTHLGGDPGYPKYRIGDRVMVTDDKIYFEQDSVTGYFSPKGDIQLIRSRWPAPGTHNEGYCNIDGLYFDLGAFALVDIAEERDEKINSILDGE